MQHIDTPMFGYACKRIGYVPNLCFSIPTPLGLLMQQFRLENKLSSPHGSCHLDTNHHRHLGENSTVYSWEYARLNWIRIQISNTSINISPTQQYSVILAPEGIFSLISELFVCGKYLVTGKDWGCLSYIARDRVLYFPAHKAWAFC